VALMRPFLEDWIRSYDRILFSRIDHSIPIAEDEIRVPTNSYRMRMELRAERVLRDVPSVKVLPIDREERLRYALGIIFESLASEP